MKHLSDEQIRQVVDGYESGATVSEMGDQFGIDRKRAGRILKREGVQMRGVGLTPAQVDEAVRLYESGWSLVRIGEKFSVHARTVHRRLRERAVVMRDTHGRER